MHLTIKIGGPAGSGVMTVGAMISKILKRSGRWVYSTADYPSLIKGVVSFLAASRESPVLQSLSVFLPVWVPQ